jgi:acyl carrier protein
MSVKDELRAILADHVTVPEDDLAPLELDSLAIVQIVEAIEDRYEIRIAPRDVTARTFGTLSQLARLVEDKTQ